MTDRILVIACGALAREIRNLRRLHGWHHLDIRCLDARLHNRPNRIADCLRASIARYARDYERVFVAYADCGTRGEIDRVLAETGAERLPGAHCYHMFAGEAVFNDLSADEPGTFYLTDFLVRHFEQLVIRPLQLDVHPELLDAYFGHYRRVLYLSQQADAGLVDAAKAAASRLHLSFEHRPCGYGTLESELKTFATGVRHGEADRHQLA